jgi:CheY-like chemotaxis protein
MHQEPFPKAVAAGAAAPATPVPGGGLPSPPKMPPALRILAADDVRVNREWLRHLARHFGFEAEVVENGAEVLAALSRRSFDLILLDVQMPVMDGLTAAREIVRLQPDPSRRPKILALTATALTADRSACLAAGMDECLPKPVSPAAFAACVERLFAVPPLPAAPAPSALQPTPSNPPLIDFTQLNEAIPGLSPTQLATMHRRMHRAVASDFETIWPRVLEAVSSRDQARLAESLHALKGCFSTLGWNRIAALCAAAMVQARTQQFAGWTTLPDELQRLYAASTAEMTRHLAAVDSEGAVPPEAKDEGGANSWRG